MAVAPRLIVSACLGAGVYTYKFENHTAITPGPSSDATEADLMRIPAEPLSGVLPSARLRLQPHSLLNLGRLPAPHRHDTSA